RSSRRPRCPARSSIPTAAATASRRASRMASRPTAPRKPLSSSPRVAAPPPSPAAAPTRASSPLRSSTRRALPDPELEAVCAAVDLDLVALTDLAGEQLHGQRVLDLLLDQ